MGYLKLIQKGNDASGIQHINSKNLTGVKNQEIRMAIIST